MYFILSSLNRSHRWTPSFVFPQWSTRTFARFHSRKKNLKKERAYISIARFRYIYTEYQVHDQIDISLTVTAWWNVRYNIPILGWTWKKCRGCHMLFGRRLSGTWSLQSIQRCIFSYSCINGFQHLTLLLHDFWNIDLKEAQRRLLSCRSVRKYLYKQLNVAWFYQNRRKEQS